MLPPPLLPLPLLQATGSTTIWGLADDLDVDAVELLANNTATVGSPTEGLGGRFISVCRTGGAMGGG